MNRRRADAVVGLLVAVVVLVGGALGWQAYRQQQAFEEMGPMMGPSMGAVHGTNPLWYVLGTVLVSAVIGGGGGYLTIRDDLTSQTRPAIHRVRRRVRPTGRAPNHQKAPSNRADQSIQKPSHGPVC